MILFSARIIFKTTCDFCMKNLGSRKIAVIKEMTKMFEEIVFINLEDYQKIEPKGEYVLVMEGSPLENPLLELSIEEHLRYYLDQGEPKKTLSRKWRPSENF